MLETKALQVEWDSHFRTFNAPGSDVSYKILQFATSLVKIISTQSNTPIKDIVSSSSFFVREKSVFINLFYREFIPLSFGLIGSFIRLDKDNVKQLLVEHRMRMARVGSEGLYYRNLYQTSLMEIKRFTFVLSDNEKKSFSQLFSSKPTTSEVFIDPEIRPSAVMSLSEVEEFVWIRIKYINKESLRSGLSDDDSYINPEFRKIFAQILFNVSSKAQVPVQMIFLEERTREVVLLRQIAMVEFFETIKNISDKKIVKFFGKRRGSLGYSKNLLQQLEAQKNPDYLRLKVDRIPPLCVYFSLNFKPIILQNDELWNKVWDEILKAVCVGLGVTYEQLNTKGRSQHVVDSRIIVFWLVYKTEMLHRKNFSLEEIGKLLAGMHHSTIIHSRRSVRNLMNIKRKDFYVKFSKVFELLKGKFPQEIEEEIWNFKVEEKESKKTT